MHKFMSELHQDHVNLARLLTIMEQHDSMPTATVEFQDMIDNVAHGEHIIDKETLKATLDEFIALQKSHMDIEEEKLFQCIEQQC